MCLSLTCLSLAAILSTGVEIPDAGDALNIGWAEADVTPPLTKRVPLDGQYYQRLADTKDPIHTRLKFVAAAIISQWTLLNLVPY